MNEYEAQLEKLYKKEKLSDDDFKLVYRLMNASGPKNAMCYYYAARLLESSNPQLAKEYAKTALTYQYDLRYVGQSIRLQLQRLAGDTPHPTPRPAPRLTLRPDPDKLSG